MFRIQIRKMVDLWEDYKYFIDIVEATVEYESLRINHLAETYRLIVVLEER